MATSSVKSKFGGTLAQARRIGGAARLLGIFFACTAAAAPPPLFVYPLAGRLPDGQILVSPQTINLAQATVDVPRANTIRGVVLIVYWSTLCPQAARCDFKLIDEALTFWARRGRQIVLDVAPIGYPYRTAQGLQNSVPAWAAKATRSYSIQAKILAVGRPESEVAMPDFTDDRFLALVRNLVQLMARYDGNPAVAQIRIATGLMGEDNPLIGPVQAKAAGFSEREWLDFTQRLAAIYFANFKHTQLEFDIGRLAWMAARGSAADRQAVEAFIDNLLSHRVFLSFNGLNDESMALLQQQVSANGLSVALQYLKRYKARGGSIGLEAAAPATAPTMRNIPAIRSVVATLKPDRLVLFSGARCAGTCNDPGDQLLRTLGYD